MLIQSRPPITIIEAEMTRDELYQLVVDVALFMPYDIAQHMVVGALSVLKLQNKIHDFVCKPMPSALHIIIMVNTSDSSLIRFVV